MLSSPPRTRSLIPPHPPILNQALPQTDQARYADDEGNHVRATTTPIRSIGRGHPAGEEHAPGNKPVPEHFRIRGQDIGEEDVAELAIARFSNAADADAFEGCEEAPAAGEGEVLVREEEEDGEEEEVGLW